MTTVTQVPCFTQIKVGNFGHNGHYRLEPIFPARKRKKAVISTSQNICYYFPKTQQNYSFFFFLLTEPQNEGKYVVAARTIL